MDEDEPPQVISSDSRPTDIGQIHPVGSPPKLEIVCEEGASFSDPSDEIYEGPRPPTRLSEEVVKVEAATLLISTPPPSEIGPEQIQENCTSSLHIDISDACDEDPVTAVPDVTPPSPIVLGPALSVPPTPKRSVSRSRSRSSSPSLLSSPLTRLSSSPMREEDTRHSTPDSDFTDVETTSKPIKTSVKRRSIGGVDFRVSKKSRVETPPVDSAADIKLEEPPVSKPRRKTGKKQARSSSPSPRPESPPVSMQVTATSNATNPDTTDQSIMGMVVEALAMTRASSMDVESIRKIVAVRLHFFTPFHYRSHHLIGRIPGPR